MIGNTKPTIRGVTLLECICLVAAITISIAMLLFACYVLAPAREVSHRMKCRSNLRQLGIALNMYVDDKGDQRYYPWPAGGGNFTGAEWLLALYWSKVITEPGIYNCPNSMDDNLSGTELGAVDSLGFVGTDSVSYAAKGRRVSPVDDHGRPRCITEAMPGDTIMASDDTEGDPNHPREGWRQRAKFTTLFFDGHVEYLTGLDVNSAVGRDAPLDAICN